MKKCNKCGETKPLTEFNKHKRHVDGLRSECKICHRASSNRWRAENPEKKKEMDARYVRENSDKIKEYREKTKERRAFLKARWDRNNAGRKAATQMKRYAAQMRRTPLWANMKEIEYFYKAAKLLEMITGEKWQVDHVIPLQGKLVSGLHVETNLQLLKASDNRRKYNTYEI